MLQDDREFVVIHIRTPKALKDMIHKCVFADTHTNLSEFVRAAIREKIQRESPHLFQELGKKEE